MEKIAFVKIKYDDTIHRVPATDIKEEGVKLVIYNGEKKVGEFDGIE
jgi:hypothetical protein